MFEKIERGTKFIACYEKKISPKSKADFIQLLNFSEYSLIRIHSYTVLVKNITLKCFYSVSTRPLENTVAWFTKFLALNSL